VTQFLWGALAMGSWVAGLFFVRFWRSTRDRFFAYLGVAFWIFALSWTGLVVVQATDETRHYHYLVRLAAFLCIIVGIVDKNRKAR
jgi:hypothetical protein